MHVNRRVLVSVAAGLVALASPALAQKKYDPGASDSEIKVGNIMPYSGPASAYGTIGRAEAAYFRMINEQGGINGRKITFISYDDAYSPPKTVEQARKLVEGDEVLLIYQPLGTAPNSAIQKYMNTKKVPQLFVATGATKWGDPKNFPWTMGFQPNYQSEGRIYAKYILQHHAAGKIAVLYQNDDYGKHGLKGDPGLRNWTAFMDKYFPEGNKADTGNVTAYITAKALVQVLKQCGDNLTRENVMRQAANLRDFEIDMLLDGIKVNTSPTDYFPVEELQMRRFNGEVWELFGPIMSGEIGS